MTRTSFDSTVAMRAQVTIFIAEEQWHILYIKFNLAIVLLVSRLNQPKSLNIPVTLSVGW